MNENENNEVLVFEEVENNDEPEVIEEGSSGMSTGLAMLIGGGIALGAVALGKKLKKVWDKRKAQKEPLPVIEGEKVNLGDDEDHSSNVTSIQEDDE